MRYGLLVVLCTGLLACKDSGSKNNGNPDLAGGGGGGSTVLTSQTTLPVGSTQCANGGTLVQSGTDNGDGGGTANDGMLQAGEVDVSTPICAQAPSTFATVTKTTPLDVGDMHCPFGGSLIEFGLDDGSSGGTANNGALEPGEKDGQTYACAPKPGDLLVETTPLYPTDPTCPYGGQIVHSGLDDGRGGGVKGDGLLQAGEITLNQTLCNAAPGSVFPPPTGANGTNVIDGRAGTSTGLKAGQAGGGTMAVANIAGPLAGSVEIYKNGSLTLAAATSSATYTAGAKELVVSDTVTIPVSKTATTGLYLLGSLSGAVDMGITVTALPLYQDGTLVNSVHVTSTGVLRFQDTEAMGQVKVVIDGDFHNEGVVKGLTSTGTDGPLAIECHHFLNSGKVGSPGQPLAIWATQGTGAEIVNSGEINTAGVDNGGGASAFGGQINLIAAAGVTNTTTGIISARGGDSTLSDIAARFGAYAILYSYAGKVRNSGTILTTGGSAQSGGNGGTAALLSMPYNVNFFTDKDRAPLINLLGPIPTAIIDSQKATSGTFGIEHSGTINSKGGQELADVGVGGAGGDSFLATLGGSIKIAGTINVDGGGAGTGLDKDKAPAVGGNIIALASTLVFPDGTIQVPTEISIGGNLSFRGGTPNAASIKTAGRGGNFMVTLDAMLQAMPEQNVNYFVLPFFNDFDRAQLNKQTVQPRVQILGVQDILLQGSSSTTGSAGNGGTLGLAVATTAQTAAFAHVGSHFVYSNANINLSAGTGGTAAFKPRAGYMEVYEYGAGNLVPAVIEASGFELQGTIVGRGADITKGDVGDSTPPQWQFGSTSGTAVIGAKLDLSGGTSKDAKGGNGASLHLSAFMGTISGTLDLSGGTGPTGGARAGVFESEGFEMTLTATSVIKGRNGGNSPGYISFMESGSCSLLGVIDLSGLGTTAGVGASGGGLGMASPRVTTMGTINLNGAAGTTQGGNGGGVEADVVNWSQNATFTINGGACTSTDANCVGGSGGGFYFAGAISGMGISLAGGSATVTGSTGGGAAGGKGGPVMTKVAPSIPWGITASLDGGAASTTVGSATGGQGGGIFLSGIVEAALSAKGGNATRGSGTGTVTATGGQGGTANVQATKAAINLAGGDATGSGANLTTVGGAGGSGNANDQASCDLITAAGGSPGGAAGVVCL